jgi:hypothetical protein
MRAQFTLVAVEHLALTNTSPAPSHIPNLLLSGVLSEIRTRTSGVGEGGRYEDKGVT